MRLLLPAAAAALLPLLLTASSSHAAPTPSVFIAAGDVGESAFQLLRVDFSNSSSPFTPIGPRYPQFVLVQGDATAYDSSSGTFFAVLNAVVGGQPNYANTTLVAFDAKSGGIKWSLNFAANETMGALAWEPTLGQLVGLCGPLLVNLTVRGYCGVLPPAPPSRPLPSLSLIADWHSTLSYDPDTRSLDAGTHKYYHRLYNNTWMPDYFVTLDSRTGALQQFCQFFSPEFSGTRVNTQTHQVFSICNADAGLDLCIVDPSTGDFTPLNVFDRMRQSDELFAATAVLDAAHSLYLLAVDFADDGFFYRAVDIDESSPTYATIVANYTVPSQWFPSNFHVLGGPDD